MWGGWSIHPATTAMQQLGNLSSFIEASGQIYDPPNDIQTIMSYVNAGTGAYFADFFTNTLPEAYPSILNNLTSITPLTEETLMIADLLTLTEELSAGQANGQRVWYDTITVRSDAVYFEQARELFDIVFSPLFNTSTVVVTALSWQPVTKPMLAPGCGMNSLGLCPSDGNLVIMNWNIAWLNSTGDEAVKKAADVFLQQARDLGRERGVLDEYVYLNYAQQEQNPIASYGEENVKFLRNVSRRYDPEGVFQKLVPGGFKLYWD